MTKILILQGDSYKAVGKLFESRGYEVLYNVERLPEASCVVFTGGSDVHPSIYGEEFKGARGCNLDRDLFEVEVYEKVKALGVPMIGICRGGQLLNVLNGGEMLQDHGLISGIVASLEVGTDALVEVLVDHHQGMYSNSSGWCTLIFDSNPSDPTAYEIWYPETKSLCVQYHPEWGHKGTEDRFFELIEQYGVLQ